MKIAVFVLLACAAVGYGGDSAEIKKLGAVTWYPDTHKLVWVVEKGTIVNGQFVPSSELRYEVSPQEALMALGDEQRGIDSDEAVMVHRLLDTLAFYCAESVAWWDRGQGTPTGPSNKPAPQKPPVGDSKVVKASLTAPSPSYAGQTPCGTARGLLGHTTPRTTGRNWL